MSIFPSNYHNIDQIIRKNKTAEIIVTVSINPYKAYHRTVRIQQFHKVL